jgi:hypothetical protein
MSGDTIERAMTEFENLVDLDQDNYNGACDPIRCESANADL